IENSTSSSQIQKKLLNRSSFQIPEFLNQRTSKNRLVCRNDGEHLAMATMVLDVDSKSDSGFPYWNPVRRRFSPESPFFQSGNIERELLAKQIALDLSEDQKHSWSSMDEDSETIHCPIVGCRAPLSTMGFENHYISQHTAACSVCHRAYPTSRLLSMHISEAHDSFFQAKVARGYPMYECLVEGCGLKFKSYKSRQKHLVDKHKFPASYDFFKKGHHLSKKAREKIHRKKPATTQKNKEEEGSSQMEEESEEVNCLTSALSKMTTGSTPKSVSFGRGNTRGLTFVPRAVQRDIKKPDPTPP
ncbi:Zinc finger protein 511, partial [Linum perenne]